MSLTALWRLKSWWSPSPQAPASPPLLWRETELRGASLRAGSTSVSSSAGCSQPQLDPWDPAILALVNITPSVTCHSSQPSLLYTRQDRLHLNTSAGQDFTSLSCFYSYIHLLDTDTFSLSPEETVGLSNSPLVLSSNFSSLSVRCIVSQLSWLDLLPRPVRWWLAVEIYSNVLLYIPR